MLRIKLSITSTTLEAVLRIDVLIHPFFGLEFAAALGAFKLVFCITMLIHLGTSRELKVTIRAFEPVICLVMQIHCFPSPKFAIALWALYQAVSRIVVRVPRFPRSKLDTAFRTLETVACVIMLV